MKYMKKLKGAVGTVQSKKEVELFDFEKIKTVVANTQLPPS